MDDKLVDYSFLEELSGGDPQYKYDVIGIFLDTMNDGMSNLEQLVAGDDYEAIEKQSHALKSSAGIVKVRGMYDHLRRMEELGRKSEGKEEIQERFSEVHKTYKEAKPILEADREIYRQKLEKE